MRAKINVFIFSNFGKTRGSRHPITLQGRRHFHVHPVTTYSGSARHRISARKTERRNGLGVSGAELHDRKAGRIANPKIQRRKRIKKPGLGKYDGLNFAFVAFGLGFLTDHIFTRRGDLKLKIKN